jgi:hypothetical protein
LSQIGTLFFVKPDRAGFIKEPPAATPTTNGRTSVIVPSP